jgi:hypothetical protein
MNGYRQQYADNQKHFFSPRHSLHIHPHAQRVFASSFSTGPPGDRGALHCRWNVIATQPLGLVSIQARGILPVAEEQSRLRGKTHTNIHTRYTPPKHALSTVRCRRAAQSPK